MQEKQIYKAEQYFIWFREGREIGFKYFFDLHYKPLVHFAYSIINDQSLAEDLVEDCFLKFWNRRLSIDNFERVKAYLFISVKNACLTAINREKYKAGYLAYVAKTGNSFEPDLSHKIISVEAMHHLHTAIQKLSPKHRELVEMLYLEEQKLSEIARKKNLPLSTVKSQKAKALQLLRIQLQHLNFLLFLFL